MAQFNYYTSAPSETDKFFIKTTKGGYNSALQIKSNGSCLPNCVGFVHGQWCYELAQAVGIEKACEYERRLSRNNAVAYWNYNDGFDRGQTPKLGSIIVWSGGKQGYGHVAVVCKIYDNKDIDVVASDYGGRRWYKATYRASNHYGFTASTVYKCLGFIYPPVDFTDGIGTPVQRDESKEQIEVLISNLNARDNASINADRLGYINKGVYNILQSQKGGSYTWYEVEPNTWIASSDGWTQVLPKSGTKLYDVKFSGVSTGDMIYLSTIGDELKLKYEVTE